MRPKLEAQFKSWGSCIPNGGNSVPGERLSEVTVMLRAKFRNYLQAVVEKLAENVGIILKFQVLCLDLSNLLWCRIVIRCIYYETVHETPA